MNLDGGRTVRLVGSAFGRCVAISCPGAWASEVLQRLPPGWTPVTASAATPVEREWALVRDADGGWAAECEGATFAASPQVEAVLDVVCGDVELWLAEHAEGLIFVHAGVVAVEGRALLVPGRTRAGKSTLTAALVRAGAGYLSDEYAVIDAAGTVHPYARPLSLRGDDGGSARRVPVADLGGKIGEPARLALVAAVRFDPAGWVVRPMSPAETVLALVDNTIAAQSRPVEMMDHLQAAMRAPGASGLAGCRGEAADTAFQLIRLTRSNPE